jgi:hypothetical protein
MLRGRIGRVVAPCRRRGWRRRITRNHVAAQSLSPTDVLDLEMPGALPQIRPPGPEYDPFDDLLVTSDVHAGVVVRSAVDRPWDERHGSGWLASPTGQVEPAFGDRGEPAPGWRGSRYMTFRWRGGDG